MNRVDKVFYLLLILVLLYLKAYCATILGFDSVFIGQHRYRVLFQDAGFDSNDTIGTLITGKEKGKSIHDVLIRAHMPLDTTRATVVHEILIHGCYQETGLTKEKLKATPDEEEEEVARSLDGCIADVILKNPELMRFLERGIE